MSETFYHFRRFLMLVNEIPDPMTGWSNCLLGPEACDPPKAHALVHGHEVEFPSSEDAGPNTGTPRTPASFARNRNWRGCS
jgi:hypothetical protein